MSTFNSSLALRNKHSIWKCHSGILLYSNIVRMNIRKHHILRFPLSLPSSCINRLFTPHTFPAARPNRRLDRWMDGFESGREKEKNFFSLLPSSPLFALSRIGVDYLTRVRFLFPSQHTTATPSKPRTIPRAARKTFPEAISYFTFLHWNWTT